MPAILAPIPLSAFTMSSPHEQSNKPEQGLTLAIVIPTFNESLNVAVLVERLHTTLQGVSWEAVFVDDDSPDGTVQRLRVFAEWVDEVSRVLVWRACSPQVPNLSQ